MGYRELARVMVAHRVPLIQLRLKERPREELRALAAELRPLVTPPSRFIVNDDPEIAREVGADGVHLGQEDMPYPEARRILGEGALIGLSTHNPEQTRRACALGPDYIGIGPVFATPTKRIPDPVLGLERMAEMLALATVPAVCIGGIDLVNLPRVLAAGARNVCAVRPVTRAPYPGKVLAEFMRLTANR